MSGAGREAETGADRDAGRGALVLTRPLAEARASKAALGRVGREVLLWPLSEIRPTGAEVVLPEGCRGVIFTSANGVRSFAASSAERALPALCVGARTADAARETGFGTVESAGGDAADLTALIARRPDAAGPWLHARGRDTAGDLAGALAAQGAEIHEAVLYAAEPVEAVPEDVAAAFSAGRIAILSVWSARNAGFLAQALARRPDWERGAVTVVAISARAAAPLDGMGFETIVISDAPSGDAMVRALIETSAALRR